VSELGDLWGELEAGLLPLIAAHRADLAKLSTSRKPDGTIVSRADLEAETFIVEMIREFDPAARIVAEEQSTNAYFSGGLPRSDGDNVWVVDPIDGTSQFLDPEGVEYCSVIALLEHGQPRAAMILAPELGPDRQPVMLTADTRTGRVLVDGSEPAPAPLTRLVSATRSSRCPPWQVERAASDLGFSVKVRATSATLDMARAVVDLEPATGLQSFRCFAGRQPLLWDAAAGLTIAAARGRVVFDECGAALCRLEPALLAVRQPRLPTVILAHGVDRAWMLSG
jgi:3'(2'), 5'-bisphosphate nucleotidase